MKSIFQAVQRFFLLFVYRRKLKQFLPTIFADIDKLLPSMIGQCDSVEIEELIARSINKATANQVNQFEIEVIVGLYSPIIAASKAFGEK